MKAHRRQGTLQTWQPTALHCRQSQLLPLEEVWCVQQTLHNVPVLHCWCACSVCDVE